MSVYAYTYDEDGNPITKDYFTGLYRFCSGLKESIIGITPKGSSNATVVYGTKNSSTMEWKYDQQYNLIQNLTVLENVELPLIYQGIDPIDRRELAIQALTRVGLADRAQHKPTQMSGGQQQRVAIARAISTHPPIIMADEPTGALDSRTGHEVLGFLQQLNKEGSTVILITHDNGIAATARRIVRIADGKIFEDHRQEVDWY